MTPDDLITLKYEMEEKVKATLGQTEKLQIELSDSINETDRFIAHKILNIRAEMRGQNQKLDD